ncbi:MAG: 1-deoxy-D-xylulose-5-phosphate synthase, partial [Bacteroidales bacterium]|nr:1-deoxy-D-xylulose-5-phosphate synthase [Bacteroidales bacterium]
LQIGKGTRLTFGEDLAVLTIGPIGNTVLKTIEILGQEDPKVSLYNMRFVKPIDEELLHQIFKDFDQIITIEDGSLMGGLASAVAEFKVKHQYMARCKSLGIPDEFIQHGTPAELHAMCGFDLNGILKSIRNF